VTATAEKDVDAVLRKWDRVIRYLANKRYLMLPFAIKSNVDYDDLAQAARLGVAKQCDLESKASFVHKIIRRRMIDEIRDRVGRGGTARNNAQLKSKSIQSDNYPQLHQWPTIDKISDIKILDCLPDINKKVVCLYYGHGIEMKEVGKILNYSESRISQLHSESMKIIRKYCEENPHDY
jgi:RNA polymerase sigma factor (sigma-70 family)